jgi:hypothetical protein
MDSSEVDFVVRAKRQLRVARRLTIVAVGLAIASLIASIVLKEHRYLARAIAYGALLGAFLVTSDFALSGSIISRARLIEALEAQLNRNAEALKLLAQRQASRGQ